MLNHVIPNIDYGSAFSNWLNLWMNLSTDNKELAVCGADAIAGIKAVQQQYLPHVVLAGSTSPSKIPFLQNRFDEKDTLFYICENRNCQLPVRELTTALDELAIK